MCLNRRLYCSAFENFQFKTMATQIILCERIHDRRNNIRLLKLGRGNIDRHGNWRQTHEIPCRELGTRCVKHPNAQRGAEADFIHQVDKFAGRHQSTLRRLPPYQSLSADNLAGLDLYFGLVMQQKFISLKRKV